jgi:hypothetical protein
MSRLKNEQPLITEFLIYYTENGYKVINDFIYNGKIPNIIADNNELYRMLSNLHEIIFKKKLFYDEIIGNKDNIFNLFAILIERMDKVIKESPPLTNDILVFKGIKNQYNPDRKSFISTSLNLDVSSKFVGGKCCKTYFILKKGTHALALLHLSKHSEYELLLPYDVKMKLIEKNTEKINPKVQKTNVDVYEINN